MIDVSGPCSTRTTPGKSGLRHRPGCCHLAVQQGERIDLNAAAIISPAQTISSP